MMRRTPAGAVLSTVQLQQPECNVVHARWGGGVILGGPDVWEASSAELIGLKGRVLTTLRQRALVARERMQLSHFDF